MDGKFVIAMTILFSKGPGFKSQRTPEVDNRPMLQDMLFLGFLS